LGGEIADAVFLRVFSFTDFYLVSLAFGGDFDQSAVSAVFDSAADSADGAGGTVYAFGTAGKLCKSESKIVAVFFHFGLNQKGVGYFIILFRLLKCFKLKGKAISDIIVKAHAKPP
jgi:hypothetical protein